MQRYNIHQKYGNAFQGVQFTVLINGIAPTSNLVALLMQVRKSLDTPALLTLSHLSGLKIIDPVNCVFTIEPKATGLTLNPGEYIYDILLTFSDGYKDTYVGGEICVKGVSSRG